MATRRPAFERPIQISDILPTTDREWPFVVKWEEAIGGPTTEPRRKRFRTDRAAARFRRRLLNQRNANRAALREQEQRDFSKGLVLA